MGLRVMIVDDSVFMRNMLKKLITEAGAEIVAEAGDGKEAITKYNEIKPDLVFLDIVMPNLDGIEALKSIRAADGNSRVIMCTSTGQEMVVKEAVNAGASDFIVKPFSKEDITTLIQKYSAA
ncbi:response regulator [Candidatus Woesearchaeota archaeon]|nr:response regulator [Candidatus Woesearchaeota archaeon]